MISELFQDDRGIVPSQDRRLCWGGRATQDGKGLRSSFEVFDKTSCSQNPHIASYTDLKASINDRLNLELSSKNQRPQVI